MYRRTATITVAALDAAAEETYTITETMADGTKAMPESTTRACADVIVINPPAAAEASWIITKAWVHAVGVIKFSASNVHATDALTGGALTINYCVIR